MTRVRPVLIRGFWFLLFAFSFLASSSLPRAQSSPPRYEVYAVRFAHMIETLYGLARLGHVNPKGMPSMLQLALVGQEFRDVIVFRKPPPAVQGALFGVLAPIARWRGYRATYPQLSRTVLAPRE